MLLLITPLKWDIFRSIGWWYENAKHPIVSVEQEIVLAPFPTYEFFDFSLENADDFYIPLAQLVENKDAILSRVLSEIRNKNSKWAEIYNEEMLGKRELEKILKHKRGSI